MLQHSKHPFWGLSLLLALSVSLRAQDFGWPEPGKPSEQVIKKGAVHTYQIALTTGQLLDLRIQQLGVDIAVEFYGPEGALLLKVDSPNDVEPVEPLLFAAKADGTYRLQIKAPARAEGRYVMISQPLQAAGEQDGRRLGRQGQLLSAIDKYLAKRFAEALAETEKVLEQREKELDAQHPDMLHAWFVVEAIARDLGKTHLNNDNLTEAFTVLQRALKIRRQHLPVNVQKVADYMYLSGESKRRQGSFTQAEEFFAQAMQECKKLPPEGIAQERCLAAPFGGLAKLNERLGRFDLAEQNYAQVVEKLKKVSGPQSLAVAVWLNNQGTFYYRRGQGERNPEDGRHFFQKAEPLYREALAIAEPKKAEATELYAGILQNLGAVHYAARNYPESLLLYQAALALLEEKKAAPRKLAIARHNLAQVFRAQKQYGEAERWLAQALQGVKELPEAESPEVARIYDTLATICQLEERYAEAIAAREQAAEIRENELKKVLALGSEQRKQNYLETLEQETDAIISLNLRVPDNASASRLALMTVLRRRGRSLEVTKAQLDALRNSADKENKVLLQRFEAQTALLATSYFGRGDNTAESGLREEVEQLEDEISRRSSRFMSDSLPALSYEQTVKALPPRSALVVYSVFYPFNPDNAAEAFGAARYVAHVMRADASSPQIVDLGAAREIEEKLLQWRGALQDPSKRQVYGLGRAADRLVMQPLRPFLKGAQTLLIIPDGELNLIPFHALIDESWHYLLDKHTVTLLNNARELLPRPPSGKANPPVAFANPLFDLPNAQAAHSETGRTGERFIYKRLPGTEYEASKIADLWPEARLLIGKDATEGALKDVHSPALLTLATHGRFLGHAPRRKASVVLGRDLITDEPPLTSRRISPLLQSFLVLAGAKQGADMTGEDGFLTALEASALDLKGTKVAILSACETGLGKVTNGEGVYGLRRALALAGSETQLFSLWSVPDKATAFLLSDFYQRLSRGAGRAQALREAQQTAFNRAFDSKSRQQVHPYYWAGFTISGEWRSLEQK